MARRLRKTKLPTNLKWRGASALMCIFKLELTELKIEPVLSKHIKVTLVIYVICGAFNTVESVREDL